MTAPRVLFIALHPLTSLGGGESYMINAFRSSIRAGCVSTLAFPIQWQSDQQGWNQRAEVQMVVPVKDSAKQKMAFVRWADFLKTLPEYSMVWVNQYLSNNLVFDIISNVTSDRPIFFCNLGHEPLKKFFHKVYQPAKNHWFREISEYACKRFHTAQNQASGIAAGIWRHEITPPSWEDVNDKQSLRLCAIGRLLPHKGFEHTIRALGPQDCLSIIGPQGADNAYETFLKQEAGTHNVEFISTLDDQTRSKWLAQSHALVASSAHLTYDRRQLDQVELLGLVLLEAVAAGKLAIASNIPSFSEILENLELKDFLYEEGNAADLQKLLDRVRHMPKAEIVHRIQIAQQKLEEHYLWDDYWTRAVQGVPFSHQIGL